MPTIFDLVQAPEIAAFWQTLQKERAPYLGEILFPAQKQLGLDLKWIKGSAGVPVVLKPSAFDVKAVPRPRIGFDRLSAEMPFFKESTFVNEEMRQQLNMVLNTGNQVYIDSILNRVFNDEIRLIESAAARREQMRMMALTTGVITIAANGQTYAYDYGVPANHKDTVTTSWSNAAASIIDDIRKAQDTVEDDTGVRPTRAVCDSTVWSHFRKNTDIQKAIYPMTAGGVAVSDSQIKTYLMEILGLEIVVYTKRYMNDSGAAARFIPADTFVLFPEGSLGTTWFGTTPEESDLMSSGVANVALTDLGVAITTAKHYDPVNVETKVTMISMPSFENADQIFILDVTA